LFNTQGHQNFETQFLSQIEREADDNLQSMFKKSRKSNFHGKSEMNPRSTITLNFCKRK
jgi:hypothetical protein